MKRIKVQIVAFLLVFIMAAPTAVFADDYENGNVVQGNVVIVGDPEIVYTPVVGVELVPEIIEPPVGVEYAIQEWPPQHRWEDIIRTREGNNEPLYVRLRAFAEIQGARDVRWNAEARAAIIVAGNGDFITIAVEEEGGFIEDGVAWVPLAVATELQQALQDSWRSDSIPVERLDLTLWERHRFEDVREPSFSTDLPHGEISVGFIEYMNDNICARSAFTYRELEAATWIVEELLAMGHDWDNIEAQEFTYWEVQEIEMSAMGWLSWWTVTSPMILGMDREYQLRLDRVSQNIILTIPGQSDSKIIVGAHYDSPPYPSASDNASGTALLLESAQRMLEIDNYYTIVYVFFGAEEVGLIGANYYYYMLTEAERDNIVMMINADVLIEGPYVIFGVGDFPTFDEQDVAGVIEKFVEMMTDGLAEWIEMEWDFWQELYPGMTQQEVFDTIIEENLYWLEMLSLDELAIMAVQSGVLSPDQGDLAEQVNLIAEELNRANDFELLSVPEFVFAPTDHLVFLNAGHTVINFAGMERVENVPVLLANYIGEMPLRLEAIAEGFSTTILHSPLDNFEFVESIWPGMMLNNMEAFNIFLEKLLTSRFE